MVRDATSRSRSGQAMLESAMYLPLFLGLAMAVAQIGHLGLGMIMVHYGATSVARLAVENNDPLLHDGQYAKQFSKLMMAGIHPVGSPTAVSDPTEDPLTPTVTVTACAELPAYPMVGELLKSLMKGNIDAGTTCTDNPHSFGPVRLAGSGPYMFVLRGQTTVRMNYQVPT